MYPESIDKFTEKLNKLDGNTYVIEEEVTLTDGVYEGELQHDNVSNTSVRVYTGSKLTGDRIDNFILSTPSKTPWKRVIKIFSDVPKAYITYETQGDTVEADDINKVQESIVNTQKEVDRYKDANDLEISNLKNRATILENNKAEKTYVDTELNKRYLKEQVFTKEEVLQKIQDVIGAAPEALDTLQEIAEALNNDANFAGTITNELSKKVDKIEGKQLSTEDYTTEEKNKLAGIEQAANKYIHPSTHPATIIVEDSAHRFTTDTEKNNWNDANSKKHTHSNKAVLDIITQTLVDAWNSAVSHISDTIKHITSDERTLWNTVTNKSDIGHTHDDRYYTEDEINSKFVSKSELDDAGYGDMLKSIYDTNGDGIVDKAEKLTNAITISNYDTLKPDLVAQGTITPIRALNAANSPWNNTTSGFLIQSNDRDSFHILIFRSGGDGWAYRSYYQGNWSSWKIWSTTDHNHNTQYLPKGGVTWNDLKGV
ncbi:MAG: hypothetical protein E7216_04775 [Clostridium thermopalmarium]|nr:hypothetical protein [Clostridium thermopalmarium]MBE6043533.1 hypothetical protein [Clostridium thermopalmarium]